MAVNQVKHVLFIHIFFLWSPQLLKFVSFSIGTGPHHITGNGVGFKPDILDMDVMEKVLEASCHKGQKYKVVKFESCILLTVFLNIFEQVSSEDSVNMARQLALKEGLMVIPQTLF